MRENKSKVRPCENVYEIFQGNVGVTISWHLFLRQRDRDVLTVPLSRYLSISLISQGLGRVIHLWAIYLEADVIQNTKKYLDYTIIMNKLLK